VYEKIEYSSCR